MLEGCGYSVDKFNEGLAACKTTEEKQAYMLGITESLLGKTGEAYKKNNADIIAANQAQADYEATLSTLGATLEPVTTAVKEGFTLILQEVLKLVEGADVQGWIDKIKGGFIFLKDEVLSLVVDAFKFLGEAIAAVVEWAQKLSPILAGLGVALAGLAIVGLVQNFGLLVGSLKTWAMSTKLVTAAQWLLNAAMAANPITLVIIGITALVAAFVVLWKKSDKFRAFFINLWKKIQDFTGEAINTIKNLFTVTMPKAIDKMVGFFKLLPSKIWTWLLNTINKVATWASNMTAKAKEAAVKFINAYINFIKQLPSKMWTWLLNAANKVVSWGSTLATKGKAAAVKLFNAVVNKIKEIPSKIKSIGGDLVAGLWNGINNKVTWLKNKIKGFVGDVKDWLKKFFKIGSPSKLMADEIGRWLPEGIAVGIDKNAKSVFNAMKGLAVGTVGSARAGLATASSDTGSGASAGVVNNFTQVINSPKQLSRLEIYRQSKNLLGYCGGN